MKEEEKNKRGVIKENRLSNKDNPFHILSISLITIKKLSIPSLISEKLLAFNIIVFIFTMTLIISHLWISGNELISLTGLLATLVSLFASFVVSIPYTIFMSILINAQVDKINSLRIGCSILLIGLSLASSGLFFNNTTITISAIIIIGIQILSFLLGVFINLYRVTISDREVKTGALTDALGWLTGVVTLISLPLSITFFALSVILND